MNAILRKPNICILSLTDLVYQQWNLAGRQAQTEDQTIASAMEMINTIRDKHNPTHVIPILDDRESFREAISTKYKHHGSVIPQVIYKHALALTQVMAQSGYPSAIHKEAFESLDIIFALHRGISSSLDRFRLHIYCSDKRIMPMIDRSTTQNAYYSRYSIDRVKDIRWVRDKMGIEPNQGWGYLALVGYDSRGIYGVKGIGQKRALALLTEYENFDGLMKNRADVKGEVGKRLAALSELDMSNLRRLITPNVNLKLNTTLKAFELSENGKDDLII